jgi:hypothetical protein
MKNCETKKGGRNGLQLHYRFFVMLYVMNEQPFCSEIMELCSTGVVVGVDLDDNAKETIHMKGDNWKGRRGIFHRPLFVRSLNVPTLSKAPVVSFFVNWDE